VRPERLEHVVQVGGDAHLVFQEVLEPKVVIALCESYEREKIA
jgi:hypothetical protein